MSMIAKAEIRARSRAFERCFAARNAQGLVAAYYVPDEQGPIASPPGDAIVRGHGALEAMFEEQFGFAKAIELTTLEVVVEGHMASELGHARLTLHDGGEALGRYVAIWLPTDDGWRVKTDVFTLDR